MVTGYYMHLVRLAHSGQSEAHRGRRGRRFRHELDMPYGSRGVWRERDDMWRPIMDNADGHLVIDRENLAASRDIINEFKAAAAAEKNCQKCADSKCQMVRNGLQNTISIITPAALPTKATYGSPCSAVIAVREYSQLTPSDCLMLIQLTPSSRV